ncbi:MAG: calcium-binding protein [Solirubrobacteraceae bacterium]
MRTTRRFVVLLLALGAFLSIVASASATLTVVADESDAGHRILQIQGTGGEDPSVRIEGSDITINNSGGVVLDGSATNCSQDANLLKVTCADVYHDFQAIFDGGNDGLSVQPCFPSIEVDMGNGTNNFQSPGCLQPIVVQAFGGSGEDTFTGNDDDQSVTVDQLSGGAGNDTLYGGGGNDVIEGGDGNEAAIDGGAGNDQLAGEGGDDVIRGGDGNDVENGGPGNDRIGYSPGSSNDDDPGADQLIGGDGEDRLLLDAHPGGVNITLDGQANDGSPGEGDNVASDFEHIDGTKSADVFTGGPGNDQFSGNAGDDEIHGGGGADKLSGDSGDDRVFGDAGNDIVEGTNGADIVDGGAGSDQIYGDIANCSVFCNSDADQLFARDGERDIVDCGGGADQAQVDQLDIVAFCGTIDRQTVGVPGGGPGAGGGGGPAAVSPLAVAATAKLKRLIKKGLSFRYTCAAACKIVATLTYKGKKLGAGRKSLKRAGTAKVVVRIAKKSRAKVRRLKGKKLTLRLKITSKGKTTKLTRKVKLKR